ncbi:MAG: radical SAM protein [Deltaproteobacteria bacterium]|nr:radical SAM protein [Deltaproteobacteria bacterium]
MIELLERIGYRPLFCVWELTLFCNLRCLHCGSYAGARRDDELSLDECKKVADDLAALGCLRVTLSGGEPTLSPHWHELGRYLSDLRIATNVLSNGWIWTQEHVDKAKEAHLTNVGYSLDGLEEAHDAVRREGSFRRVVEAIDLNVSQGMPVAVVSHVNRLNYKHLVEFRQFLGDHGVEHWQIQLGIPSGHLSEHRDLVIDPADVLWLVPQIAEMRGEEGVLPEIFPSHNIGYYGPHEPALRGEEGMPLDVWIGCRAGCQVLGIESNGNLKGCLSLPSDRHDRDQFLEGTVADRSLTAIWRDETKFSLNRTFDESLLGGFCAVCRYRDICRGGCAWAAYSNPAGRSDNPFCFYRQAVIQGRLDLLGEDLPNAEELAAAKLAPR